MNLNDFKIKWDVEIKQGIVKISDDQKTVIADRFNGKDFLCDRPTINKIQNDLRKIGFNRYGVGYYVLGIQDINSLTFNLIHLNNNLTNYNHGK